MEEEEDSLTDYNEIIRDTGPVASIGTSCATSLAPSDDEEQVKQSLYLIVVKVLLAGLSLASVDLNSFQLSLLFYYQRL
jgi:hypothetical protein